MTADFSTTLEQNNSTKGLRYNVKIIAISYAAYVFANVLDILSSLPQVPGAEEQNPFMRTPAHEFMPSRAIAIKLMLTIALFLFSMLVYYIIKHWDAQIAAVGAALIPCYMTWSLVQTAIENILLILRWHQG